MDQSSEDFAKIKPGRPSREGDPSTDKITIKWEIPSNHPMKNPIGYDLRYKNVTGERASGWNPYKERLFEKTLVFDNLPPGSKFVFKVRMVDADDDESLFSEQSDEISTLESTAYIMFRDVNYVTTGHHQMPVKALPFKEDPKCRNLKAKTRKLFLGDESKVSSKEKTIMLIGPTGAGKTTLVEGIMNYIFGVCWTDSFRLTVGNYEAEEENARKDSTLSQTSWITCYTIYPRKECTIPYKLTVVDTPGYGHSEGIEADREITNQIRELFTEKDKKGILFLDAVCLVVKASDVRLTKTLEYIFKSVKSVFHKDIIENFCMLVTFSDGKPPTVLPALQAAGLPVNKYFSFNSSALFANNNSQDKLELQRSNWDWTMGWKEFEQFFQEIEKLDSKSLALSKEVLNERKFIEITVDNVQRMLDAALSMSGSIENEIKLMEENTKAIEKNKCFEIYTEEFICQREKTDYYNLNCKNCQQTCHKHCWTFNINLVIRTCDVFKGGRCNQTECNCDAEKHINEKFEYKYKPKKVKKTYEKMKQKYDEASKKKLTHEELISQMEKEFKQLNVEIQEMNDTLTRSTNRLKEIALCDDPLTAAEHYEFMIQEEKTIKKIGYTDRVTRLLKFKETAAQRASTVQDLKQNFEVLKKVENEISMFRQKLNHETECETSL